MESEIVKLEVPYFSQYLDVTDLDWRKEACTITSLKMVLDFYSQILKNLRIEIPTIDELIAEGLSIGGFGERGWKHEAIVRIARNHGLQAYRQEFRSKNTVYEKHLANGGLRKIEKSVRAGEPVIVSVKKNNGSFHNVPIVGVDNKGFFYHESGSRDREEGQYHHISFDNFKKIWRSFAIFVYSQKE